MNLAGLDLATTSGLTSLIDGVYTATTFRAVVPKKKFIDKEDSKLDAMKEGDIGRQFEDFLTCWLVTNKIDYVAIEAPLPSNGTRTKTEINPNSDWAGKSVVKRQVAGASLSAIFRMYGLEFVACTVCRRLNIPVVFIHQATWRKSFLGNGMPPNAKDMAKKECLRRNIKITSLDAAESVGVCFQLNLMLNPYGANEGLFKEKKPLPKTPAQEDARAAAESLFKKVED